MKAQLIKGLMFGIITASIAAIILIDNMTAKTVSFISLMAIAHHIRRKMKLPRYIPSKERILREKEFNLPDTHELDPFKDSHHQINLKQEAFSQAPKVEQGTQEK